MISFLIRNDVFAYFLGRAIGTIRNPVWRLSRKDRFWELQPIKELLRQPLLANDVVTEKKR